MPFRPLALSVAVLVLTGCGSGVTVTSPMPPSGPSPAVRVTSTIASGLDVPWVIAFVPDGSALVSERDTARILRVDAGAQSVVGTVDGVEPMG